MAVGLPFPTDAGVLRHRPAESFCVPVTISCVGVKVRWDLPHGRIEIPVVFAKPVVCRGPERFVKRCHNRFIRLGAVMPPDHHWNRTHLAVGDPTVFGLRIPVGESCRFAQLAIFIVRWERTGIFYHRSPGIGSGFSIIGGLGPDPSSSKRPHDDHRSAVPLLWRRR